ncbi:ATP-dependent zinc protease [Candidatus Woesearchaeota archaeon]|nr:ATP-dependent zinc protease [Candidatus Woesearchaeota archaeon]
MAEQKSVIGLLEQIKVYGKDDAEKMVTARIDTGAATSSLDAKLAAELRLGPIIKTKIVKSASGHGLRPVVKARIEIGGTMLEAEFTLADRRKMKFPALIGRNILKQFLIDPSKVEP